MSADRFCQSRRISGCQVVGLGDQAQGQLLSRDGGERGECEQPAGGLRECDLRKDPAFPVCYMQRVYGSGITAARIVKQHHSEIFHKGGTSVSSATAGAALYPQSGLPACGKGSRSPEQPARTAGSRNRTTGLYMSIFITAFN